MKIKIVGGNYQYDELFRSFGHSIVTSLEVAELVCFTGGADVSPELYGDSKHPYTSNDRERDRDEKAIYNNTLALGIPMVGICRGGQFLNVMNGGRMYQHVTHHTSDHWIVDLMTSNRVWVTSTHHQMMMAGSGAFLVAFSTLAGTREWYDKDVPQKDVSLKDAEVLFYPKTKCLCFQPHPEFEGGEYKPMKDYFKQSLRMYLDIE